MTTTATTTTAPPKTPLADAVEAAQAALDRAIAMDDDVDGADAALEAAEEELEAARAALANSDEPRTYSTTDGHSDVDIVCSPEELEARVKEQWSTCWDDVEKTKWVHVKATCDATDEDHDITVTVDPEEPACSSPAGEHVWRAPHAVVGGDRENPGVFGHGGGAIFHERCVCCGLERITDSWAQDPATGYQGLTSVRYKDGKLADVVKAVELKELAAGVEGGEAWDLYYVRQDGSISVYDSEASARAALGLDANKEDT